VRRFLIPASYLAFLAGFTVSGAIFYHGKPFDVRRAIISDLVSIDENPRGYVASAAGMAALGILLIPAPVVFYRRLRHRPWLAWGGVLLFALALAGAIAIGVLAPFTHGYSDLHVQLAFAAFVGITGGTLLHLIAARSGRVLIAIEIAVVAALVYLYFRPDFIFNNDHLLTGLAFWEWMLCLNCGIALWRLASAVEAAAAEREPDLPRPPSGRHHPP
jgi:hypothetical protein